MSRSKEVLMDILLNYCAKGPTQNTIITTKKECTGIKRTIELISSDEDEEKRTLATKEIKKKSFYFKGSEGCLQNI